MNRVRILGVLWLVSSFPVGFLGMIVIDLAGVVEGVGGVVLLVAAGLAGLVGASLLRADRNRFHRRASLVVSACWIVGAVLAALLFDFTKDRWLTGGPLAVVGVLTALLALPGIGGAHAGGRSRCGS